MHACVQRGEIFAVKYTSIFKIFYYTLSFAFLASLYVPIYSGNAGSSYSSSVIKANSFEFLPFL
jgi:hypothetical protein